MYDPRDKVRATVSLGRPEDIAPETIVHRVGGGSVENLRLSSIDIQQTPPGISLLVGGTPQEAAAQMLSAFPGSRKWRETAHGRDNDGSRRA